MDIAARKGGIVMYTDPHTPQVKTNNTSIYNSVPLTKEILEDADVVVLTILS